MREGCWVLSDILCLCDACGFGVGVEVWVVLVSVCKCVREGKMPMVIVY